MKGIPFSTSLVPLVMDGTKTQTRRVIKEQPSAVAQRILACPFEIDRGIMCGKPGQFRSVAYEVDCSHYGPFITCPLGKVGDILYVKESLYCGEDGNWLYRAGDALVIVKPADESEMRVWAHHKANDHQSSRFMPKWAARTFLRLTEIRAERLQEISKADALSEGIRWFESDRTSGFHWSADWKFGDLCPTAQSAFRRLWDSINGKTHPWANNDWVFAYTFERVERPQVKA